MVERPPKKSTIILKQVFKTKLITNSKVKKLKARLVAYGFEQIKGIDY